MFNYITNLNSDKKPQVEINYGDGEVASSGESNGQFTHFYHCQQAQCEFLVSLNLTNDQGVKSLVTPLSQVHVVVTR
jgi:hypothetical protein